MANEFTRITHASLPDISLPDINPGESTSAYVYRVVYSSAYASTPVTGYKTLKLYRDGSAQTLTYKFRKRDGTETAETSISITSSWVTITIADDAVLFCATVLSSAAAFYYSLTK